MNEYWREMFFGKADSVLPTQREARGKQVVKKALHHLLAMTVAFCSVGSLRLARGAEPDVKLSSTALNFPSQSAGTASAPEKLILTDAGAASLTIVEIAIAGENKDSFSQTNNCPHSPATLAAGVSCTIEVTFRPSIVGQLIAVLTINDNASGSPRSVQLRGDAAARVSAATLTPPSLDFSNQAIESTSLPRTITITNVGSEVLNMSAPIAITGENTAEFTLVPSKTTCPVGSGQLAPKASCAVGVAFMPVTPGTKSAQIIVVDDGAGSPHTVPLSGVGVAPPEQ